MNLLTLGNKKLSLVFKAMREVHIVAQICAFLKACGFFFWVQPQAGYFDTKQKRFRKHANPYVRNGVPDILLVHQGLLWGLEVKTEENNQTESQKLFQSDLCAAGGHYHVVKSVEDVKKALRPLLKS